MMVRSPQTGHSLGSRSSGISVRAWANALGQLLDPDAHREFHFNAIEQYTWARIIPIR
jgi:hypothetical protein